VSNLDVGSAHEGDTKSVPQTANGAESSMNEGGLMHMNTDNSTKLDKGGD